MKMCKQFFGTETSSVYVFLFSVVCGTVMSAVAKKDESSNGTSSRVMSAPYAIPPSLSIENLQLNEIARKKTTRGPPVAVPTTTTPSPHAITNDEDGVLYRLDNREGKACILIYTDAIVHFIAVKEDINAAVYVPEKYEASGVCDEDSSKFTISWGNFAWSIYFSKTPGGDHWFVENMELDAKTEDKHLEHINRPAGSVIHFTLPKDTKMLFPTPIGQAYDCNDELVVVLEEGDATAKIVLRKLIMQPFIFKKAEFGPRHICSPGGAKSFRDETAPVAVGSTFAVATVLLVAGYGVYRYMKVKKVQYDAME